MSQVTFSVRLRETLGRARAPSVAAVAGILLLACAADKPLPAAEQAPLISGVQRADESAPHRELAQPAASVPVARSLDAVAVERLRGSLRERLTHSADGLPRSTLPGVGEVVDARGRFQHVVVQVRGADGQLHTECLENDTQLEHVLRPGVAP